MKRNRTDGVRQPRRLVAPRPGADYDNEIDGLPEPEPDARAAGGGHPPVAPEAMPADTVLDRLRGV